MEGKGTCTGGCTLFMALGVVLLLVQIPFCYRLAYKRIYEIVYTIGGSQLIYSEDESSRRGGKAWELALLSYGCARRFFQIKFPPWKQTQNL